MLHNFGQHQFFQLPNKGSFSFAATAAPGKDHAHASLATHSLTADLILELIYLFAEPNNMKTRITQLPTGKVPYETVYGQYMKNARRKRVAVPERTRRPAETDEPEFIKMPNIPTGSFGSPPSFNLGARNRFSVNENQ